MAEKKLENSRLSHVQLLLRLSISLVFVYFGFDKIPNPQNWILFIPSWLTTFFLESSWSITLIDFIRFQGVIEVVLGIHLLFGYLTRCISVVCTLIFLLIVFNIDIDTAIVRDVALMLSSLALVLIGGGRWSVDNLLTYGKEQQE